MELFGHKLISMQGRINRGAYFKLVLVLWLISGVINMAVLALAGQEVLTALALLEAVIGITLGARRLHDLNKSGWWLLVVLIPIVNIFFAFYMLLAKGTAGSNDYGPDPLA